jgi:hypothetical protein
MTYFAYSCAANENNVGPNNSSLFSPLLLEFRGSRKRSYKPKRRRRRRFLTSSASVWTAASTIRSRYLPHKIPSTQNTFRAKYLPRKILSTQGSFHARHPPRKIPSTQGTFHTETRTSKCITKLPQTTAQARPCCVS